MVATFQGHNLLHILNRTETLKFFSSNYFIFLDVIGKGCKKWKKDMFLLQRSLNQGQS